MDRKEFYEYILKKLNIDKDKISGKLIDNILEFIDNYYSNDEEEQLRALTFLLYGIGLNNEDFKQVKMYY